MLKISFRRFCEPLYIVQAKDEAVRSEESKKLTDTAQADLLHRVNPEQTKRLPNVLPLHRGMRLILSSKDCVRLGIMERCLAMLRDIVCADDEVSPYEQVVGHGS